MGAAGGALILASGEDSLECMQSWTLVYWEGLVRADVGDRLEVTPRSVEAGSWRVENSLVQSLDAKREAGRCGQLQVCGLFQPDAVSFWVFGPSFCLSQ